MNRSWLALMLGFMVMFLQPNGSKAVENWQLPVQKPTLIHAFWLPNSDYSAGHRGVDYLVTQNQAVFAPHDGVVRFAGRVVDRNVLSITHGKNLITTFEPVCSTLRAKAVVSVGEKIGRICQKPPYVNHCGVRICLHFALKTESGYLSPLALIGGLNPSRLLPIKP